ncbi:MAG: CDP-diacylglycerol--glycerol-3-phosphate 3-phosphatidyltransferase [Actinobacteria bacterium]|nr:CDP-diacylglycerol--glycerol-3-phosphate 3-phosphatidyltransferase [Actinomycetota bacterium]
MMTIPNAITGVRALGIPLFLWCYLSLDNVALSLVVLVVGALSDYFDGKVARALHQESKLGAMLDPTIDRAYIAATVIALVINEVVPFWLLVSLVGRDLWVALALLVKRRNGSGVFEVTFLGKAATFNLLYAFPFLLVAGESGLGRIFLIVGWTFAIWGVGLYLVTALQYTYVAFKNSK